VSDSESNPINIQRGGEATLLRQHSLDRPVNVSDGSTGMHAARKSDGSVVPAKSANKGGPEAPAEWMEERDPAERNTKQADLSRAQNRSDGESHGVFGMRDSILGDCVALDSRQEPYEVVSHVRICAGGRRQRRFLPQSRAAITSRPCCESFPRRGGCRGGRWNCLPLGQGEKPLLADTCRCVGPCRWVGRM
jgi:hypothetical protein